VDESLEAYSIDYHRLINNLTTKFGGEWKVLLRLHPNLERRYKNISLDSDVIIDASQYQDINELIIASEILITDYSSCMFDAMVAGKIVFLFATDIDEYDKDRGRYFEFADLPFSLAVNNN
jgi:CDP-glycerol glycerophosphotransferase